MTKTVRRKIELKSGKKRIATSRSIRHDARPRRRTARYKTPNRQFSRRTRKRSKRGSGLLDQVRGMFTAAPPPPTTDTAVSRAEQLNDLQKFTKISNSDPGQMPKDLVKWGEGTFPVAKKREAVRNGRVLDLAPDPATYSEDDYKTMASTYSRWFPSANNIPNFSKTCTERSDQRPQPTDRLVYFDTHFPGVEFPVVQMANIAAATMREGETDPDLLPVLESQEVGPGGKIRTVSKPITTPYADVSRRAVSVSPAQKRAEAYPGQMSERAAIQRLYPKLGKRGAEVVQMQRLQAYEWLMGRVRSLLSKQCEILAAEARGDVRQADQQELNNIDSEFRGLAQLYDKHGINGSDDTYAGLGPIDSAGMARLVKRYLATRAMIDAKTKVGSDLTAGKLDTDQAQSKSRMIETAATKTLLDPRPPVARAMSADHMSPAAGFTPIAPPKQDRPSSVPLPDASSWLDRAHNTIGSYLAPKAKEQPKVFTVGGASRQSFVGKSGRKSTRRRPRMRTRKLMREN